jgi:hypothetical protein
MKNSNKITTVLSQFSNDELHYEIADFLTTKGGFPDTIYQDKKENRLWNNLSINLYDNLFDEIWTELDTTIYLEIYYI